MVVCFHSTLSSPIALFMLSLENTSFNKLTFVSELRNLNTILNINYMAVNTELGTIGCWTLGVEPICERDTGCTGEKLRGSVGWEGNAFC